MKKVKLGIIGLGHRGLDLMYPILACEEAEIVALSDKWQDRIDQGAKFVKEKRGVVVKEYTDYTELLKDDNVDAVLISSSWEQHIPMAIASLKAGKATAIEVGGAYDINDCWELVKTQEQTKTPFMFMENCCYDKFELLATSVARNGLLGEIVNCHGAYGHDLRKEIMGGKVNKHYRLRNYKNRCCDNYPTHELGPIAKLLDINRGNRLVSLVSVASKAKGLEEFAKSKDCPDSTLVGERFKQGDIINTIITCADGTTITLKLDTSLPRYYSREFSLFGTKGRALQDANCILVEGMHDIEGCFTPAKSMAKFLDNAESFSDYIPEIWKNITDEQCALGHGGMDYFVFKAFFNALLNGTEMPIDVYDGATLMCISALSEKSILMGGAPQAIPDFTSGAWLHRPRLDVVEFPKINK